MYLVRSRPRIFAVVCLFKNMTTVYTLLISLGVTSLVLGSLAALGDPDSCGLCALQFTVSYTTIIVGLYIDHIITFPRTRTLQYHNYDKIFIETPCRCDVGCKVYGDCCPDYSEPATINSTIGTDTEDRKFQCRSTLLGDCSTTTTRTLLGDCSVAARFSVIAVSQHASR